MCRKDLSIILTNAVARGGGEITTCNATFVAGQIARKCCRCHMAFKSKLFWDTFLSSHSINLPA